MQPPTQEDWPEAITLNSRGRQFVEVTRKNVNPGAGYPYPFNGLIGKGGLGRPPMVGNPGVHANAVKLIQKNKQNQWFDWLMIKYKLIN